MLKGQNLIIVGPTCSGKTTFAKKLEKDLSYRRIITYTTRPMRDGETDGIDYNFITEDEFKNKLANEEFIEHREYEAEFGKCMYGSLQDDYACYFVEDKPWVVILTPEAADLVKGRRDDVKIIFLDASDELIYARAIRRGDSFDEISRRLETDREIFDEFFKSRKWDMYAQNCMFEEA